MKIFRTVVIALIAVFVLLSNSEAKKIMSLTVAEIGSSEVQEIFLFNEKYSQIPIIYFSLPLEIEGTVKTCYWRSLDPCREDAIEGKNIFIPLDWAVNKDGQLTNWHDEVQGDSGLWKYKLVVEGSNKKYHGSGMFKTKYDPNYAPAVVPEPISSILFIAGGAVLTGRRHLKRK